MFCQAFPPQFFRACNEIAPRRKVFRRPGLAAFTDVATVALPVGKAGNNIAVEEYAALSGEAK
jgi:hypothetical protein